MAVFPPKPFCFELSTYGTSVQTFSSLPWMSHVNAFNPWRGQKEGCIFAKHAKYLCKSASLVAIADCYFCKSAGEFEKSSGIFAKCGLKLQKTVSTARVDWKKGRSHPSHPEIPSINFASISEPNTVPHRLCFKQRPLTLPCLA